MAAFKVETKNKVDIDKKPRVYFTCHPDDFDKYFKKVCDDIFKTHDCAIYYTEDMIKTIADDEKEVDLGRNNLFVIPVTFKLLTTPNRAMDEDIPYALKEHIPVLPIMMESGIDEFYSNPDKFGELQYLNPYSTDLTEISYEEKLKKYLDSVLISDELAKRVRAAFDAYIFLSYRKKDRKYANELMRLIHSHPECRDIAIWFDEFLTPGESFKENIEKILDDCKLFTLLVTPQLLEKVIDKNGEERDNYVISTELPLARKKKQEKGTDIFAVEMEETDKDALLTINIEDYVNSNDSAFRSRLLDAISRIAITTNNTPEHNFLIGLAYLEGVDVEIDLEKALELISSAAENGLKEAMNKLVSMYKYGIGVDRSYDKALEWQLKILKIYLAEKDVSFCVEKCKEYLEEAYNLLFILGEINDYTKMLNYAEKYVLNRLFPSSFIYDDLRSEFLNIYQMVGVAYLQAKHYSKAEELLTDVVAMYGDVLHKSLSAKDLRDYVTSYINLGMVFAETKRWRTAKEHFESVLSLCLTLYDYDNKFQYLLATCHHQVGYVNLNLKDYISAKKHLCEAIKLNEEFFNYAPEQTIMSLVSSYDSLGQVYEEENDCVSAEKMYIKAIDLCEELSVEDVYRKNVVVCYTNLGSLYIKLERYQEAEKILCYAESLIKQAIDFADIYDYTTVLQALATLYQAVGKYELSIFKNQEAYEKLVLLYAEYPEIHSLEIVIIQDQIALSLLSLNQFDKALDVYQKIIELCKYYTKETKTQLDRMRARSTLCIASIYHRWDKIDIAITYGKDSLKLLEKRHAEVHTIESICDLVECYDMMLRLFSQDHNEESFTQFLFDKIAFLESCYKEYSNIVVTYLIDSLVLFGRICRKNEQYKEAEKFYIKAKDLLEEHRCSEKLMAFVYHQLGDLSFINRDPKRAFDLLNKALVIYQKLEKTGSGCDINLLNECKENIRFLQDKFGFA